MTSFFVTIKKKLCTPPRRRMGDWRYSFTSWPLYPPPPWVGPRAGLDILDDKPVPRTVPLRHRCSTYVIYHPCRSVLLYSVQILGSNTGHDAGYIPCCFSWLSSDPPQENTKLIPQFR
jgi:hypothetical protein